jgi:hypothetical protein
LDQISFALPQMRDLRALPETQLLLRRRWLLSKGPGSNVSGVQRDVALKLIAGRGRIPKPFRTSSGSLAMFTAIRLASSLLSNSPADRRPGSSSE